MKQNWWKLLVVAVLVAAVGVVLAGKNRGSDNESAVAVKSGVNSSVDNTAAEQAEEAEKRIEPKPVVVAGTDSSAAPKPDQDAVKASVKEKAVSTPAAVKKEEPKPAKKAEQPAVSEKLPKLLELGSTTCIPCKKMQPIIDEIEREYRGKLEVEFIDVRENSAAVEKYQIQLIPTQIFLDADGNEVFRHQGFYAKEDILAAFESHGVDLKK